MDPAGHGPARPPRGGFTQSETARLLTASYRAPASEPRRCMLTGPSLSFSCPSIWC